MVAPPRAYDDLFRFKIDFVRRRALPLLKGGAHVEATAEDHALVDRVTAGSSDPERRSPPAAALLDRESRRASARAEGRLTRDRVAEAVVRGARAPSARFATGSCSAFPKRSTPITSCRCGVPTRGCPS